jgi:glyoxylase-like metal-dependent hydrolase (beta-lactamase superfamily II)
MAIRALHSPAARGLSKATLLAVMLAASVAAEALEPEPIQVTPRVYYVQGRAGIASPENEGFNSNAGFVVTDAGVVVVDALGTPGLGRALVRAIRRVTNKPIRRVIVTHYHADHFYGLKALKDAGAEVWAHRAAQGYLDGEEAKSRLQQRMRDLFPYVDEKTVLVRADRWLDKDERFELGGVRFEVSHMGPAHSPEDLIVAVPAEGVIFIGDILFTGRVPFVGQADSKRWLERIDRLLAMNPVLMVTGHGAVSRDPRKDLVLTRDYLLYLREVMGKAVEALVPFDEAYAKADWSRFAKVPAFDAANRINAYGTYLLMEREMLSR